MYVQRFTQIHMFSAWYIYCNALYGGLERWEGKPLGWGWKVASASVTNIIKASPSVTIASLRPPSPTVSHKFSSLRLYSPQPSTVDDLHIQNRAALLSATKWPCTSLHLSSSAPHQACTLPRKLIAEFHNKAGPAESPETLFRIILTLTAAQ